MSMSRLERDMLIRIDEHVKRLPEMKCAIDKSLQKLARTDTSIKWLTWGVRGLYGIIISILAAGAALKF